MWSRGANLSVRRSISGARCLLNALRDAQKPAYVSSPSERAVVIAQSRNWPLKDCRWFDKRCEMADVNADMVRARARQVLQ